MMQVVYRIVKVLVFSGEDFLWNCNNVSRRVSIVRGVGCLKICCNVSRSRVSKDLLLCCLMICCNVSRGRLSKVLLGGCL